MSAKPINANEILSKKKASIPDAMIEAINELLTKNWNGVESKFKRDDLIELYLSKIGEGNLEQNREIIFNNHYLDFDSIYEAEGWQIEYDNIKGDEFVYFYK